LYRFASRPEVSLGPEPFSRYSRLHSGAQRASMSSNSSKVLIAHGNTKKLRSAVDLMRDAGFEVIATPDGGDAFARFFEEEPGLVLCSAQLPGLSGVSFAAMIESQAPGTRVAILIDPEDPQDLTSAAQVPTITEPLTMAALRLALPDLPERPRPMPADTSAAQTTSGVFALAALKRFQRDNSLLAVVDEPGLHRIAAMAQHELRMSDEQVITEGDPGNGFYLVVEGQVRVTLAEKNNQEIARIGAGGFFGEMAMLSDKKRSASVWTVGPTTLLFFSRDDFMPLLADYPTLREVLSGVALKRTEENLWRTLFDDVDVQRSIGSLSETEVTPKPAAIMPPPPPPEALHTAPVMDYERDTIRVRELEQRVRELEVHLRAREAKHGIEQLGAKKQGLRSGAIGGAIAGLVVGLGIAFAMHALSDQPVAGEPLADRPSADGPRADAPRAEGPSAEGRTANGRLADSPTADGAKAAPTDAKPALADSEPTLAGVPDKPVGEPEVPLDPREAHEVPAPSEAPAVAAAPSLTPEVKQEPAPPEPVPTISEAERKKLRRELINAEHAGEHIRAIAAGTALEKGNALDWEAGFYLARAQQQGGESTHALARFSEFIANYPKNDFVDEAYFYCGEILQARGRKPEAIEAFQNAASRPKSNMVEQAKAHLATLGAAPQ
jgi:CRP-like cAMP-binding protein/TolA-binding protein